MQDPSLMPDARAQLRTQLLVDVLAGKITATQAAEKLGVSRKTWHEWQQRGLEAMLQAMSDRPNGRPHQERDPEKEQLQGLLRQQERQITAMKQSRHIQHVLLSHPLPAPGIGSKKKH
jgi:transposase